MSAARIALRLLGGVVGVLAALSALFLPVLFVANEFSEMESAKQYGGHPSLVGGIGGTLAMLAAAGFFGFVGYIFIRHAIRGERFQPE